MEPVQHDQQAHTYGEAIFVTHDGLISEGEEGLTGISDTIHLVEFRDSEGKTDHLPPRRVLAFFATPISIGDMPATLLGAVTRERDAMGRPGFFGVCQAIKADEYKPENYDDLIRLFNAGHQFYHQTFRQQRHADTIGFLTQDKDDQYALTARSKISELKVFIRDEQTDNEVVLRRMLELSERTGQKLLLWDATEGPYEALTSDLANSLIARAEAQRRAREAEIEAQRRQMAEAQLSMDPAGFRDDFQTVDLSREEKFDARARLLRYPRPRQVSVEFEEYLIALIEVVLDENSSSSGRHLARQDRNQLASGLMAKLSDGQRSSFRPRMGIGTILSVLGAAAGALLVVIALFAFLTRGGDVADTDPPAEVQEQTAEE